MNPTFSQRMLAGVALQESDIDALLAATRALRLAARGGKSRPLLAGKHFAVLGSLQNPSGISEFEAAAVALGARVSRLPPDPRLADGDLAQAGDTLRLLARLYDGVAFMRLDAQAAAELQTALGIPVFGDSSGAEDAATSLLATLGADADASGQDRHFLLQAVLLRALGQ